MRCLHSEQKYIHMCIYEKTQQQLNVGHYQKKERKFCSFKKCYVIYSKRTALGKENKYGFG